MQRKYLRFEPIDGDAKLGKNPQMTIRGNETLKRQHRSLTQNK